MNDDEKKAFKTLLCSVYQYYTKPHPDKEVLRIWWGCLNLYSLSNVQRAFDKYIEDSKFLPRAAEILAILKTYGKPMASTERHQPDPRMTDSQRVAGLAKLRKAAEELK